MAKPPAFQFYASDWLRDERVKEMTYEEKGVYIDLLALAWMEGGIPGEPARLARILRIPPRRFNRIWEVVGERWQSNGNGRLVNPRLERERDKQRQWREKSAKGGRAKRRPKAKQP